jgi:hypothetical protein
MPTACCQQLPLGPIDHQKVTVAFDGGRLLTDAGLPSLRAFDKKLRIVADLAARLPNPRAQKFLTHSCEDLLSQRVYQSLAGYPDGNDAQTLRTDPLFQTLRDVSPDAEDTLASGSTLNRFHDASSRRQAQLPPEERRRPVVLGTADRPQRAPARLQGLPGRVLYPDPAAAPGGDRPGPGRHR